MTFVMRAILEKNEVFPLFKESFPLYVVLGRTTPLGGLFTKRPTSFLWLQSTQRRHKKTYTKMLRSRKTTDGR
ncbi:hypothetical protein SAMN05216419_10439 [Nitrosomonas cryotolerans]|uniref:Uncharacterized protein n=1 Tax=Nitrosomonas cryotolerans ATCC 49181 TaxID=1131553 RepID=A0A1N6F8D4_9PROT|nr:hypothetical protein SAMN05216419_10439 [Nitrosomonas cryotolerans]SIN91476.1 hypothetical protein SAMN02743940_0140 [Nitrosomonas cryotolerans ATCC 49181]